MDAAEVFTPAMCSLLSECQIGIGCVHAGPSRVHHVIVPLAKRLRQLVPTVRLHVGIGCDVWLADLIHAKCSMTQALDAMMAAVDIAVDQGAEAAVLDAEAACKLDSAITARFFRVLLVRIRDKHPALLVGHTAYDHPTLHHDDADGLYDDGKVLDEYAWRVFLDEHGVDWEVRQVYVAPEQTPGAPPVYAPRGALAARLASSDKSFARAVDLGWVRKALPMDLYLQMHHVGFAQTVTIGSQSDVMLGWCGPMLPAGRMDESGAWALRGLCALERAGARTPSGIRATQRAAGLAVDGIAGRDTLRAIGLIVPSTVK